MTPAPITPMRSLMRISKHGTDVGPPLAQEQAPRRLGPPEAHDDEVEPGAHHDRLALVAVGPERAVGIVGDDPPVQPVAVAGLLVGRPLAAGGVDPALRQQTTSVP